MEDSLNNLLEAHAIIRPHSVPVKNHAFVPKLPDRSRIDVSKPNENHTPTERPQAPISGNKHHHQQNKSYLKASVQKKIDSRRKSKQLQEETPPSNSNSNSNSNSMNPKMKPRTLSENWKAMAYNDRRNLSRKLNSSQESQNIHFINVDDNDSTTNYDDHDDHDDDATIDLDYENDVNSNIVDNQELTSSTMFCKNEIIETLHGKSLAVPSTIFSIPLLPSGRKIKINILSTWGDPYYVGLMGIDVFDGNGHPVFIDKIYADPPDINILPDYNDDPRTISNLIDGVNHTCDDLHAWLAPFTAGQNHEIWIEVSFTKSPLALMKTSILAMNPAK